MSKLELAINVSTFDIRALMSTKLGRICSNSFEFCFFEFDILNSDFEFEFKSRKFYIRPNSDFEFEFSNLVEFHIAKLSKKTSFLR